MRKNKKDIKWFFAMGKPWYMKWWLWLCMLIIVLSIPIIINELYKFGNSTGRGYITLWDAKDALAFYGSFLAFIGTISLGVLALHQNQVFKDENEKMNRKLMQAQIFSSCAFYKVGSCRVNVNEDEGTFQIVVYLKNIGKAVAICTIPYEFEFSRYGYKTEKHTQDIFLQVCDTAHTNVLSEGIIDFVTDSISLKMISEQDVFYAHMTLSIVSENQMQYDQVIQMKFEKRDGILKYVSEYPAQFLRLYE